MTARLDADFSTDVRTAPLLMALGATAVGGALLGAMTNAVTGAVAPDYFRVVLGWWEIEDVWRAAVAEGVFEGVLFGFFGALVFAVIVGIWTRCHVGPGAMVKALVLAALTAAVGWVLGGLIGIGIALLSPERFERMLRVPDDEQIEFGAVAFGWAGGSIPGLLLGALAGATIAAIRIRSLWKVAQAASTAPKTP